MPSKNGFIKVLSIIVPVLAFTVLVPVFEHPASSQVSAKAAPAVLGAFSGILPHEGEVKTITPYRINFDKPLSSDAKAFLVYDLESGKTLFSQDIDQKLQIASLTKLMTAIVASEDQNFLNQIEINSADQISIAPYLGLKKGDQVNPLDLLKAMIVGSANDAALTLANHFPNRADFVAKMNAKAVDLGMINTNFSNPMGFDSEANYSTAADLQKLVDYALANLPYEDIWQTPNYVFKTASGKTFTIKNSNTLVFNHPEIKSIKTGQTPGASGNMVIETASPDGHKIIVIELGSPDRNQATLELLDYAFKNFSWK